jgi:hypothetical protein
MHHKLRVVRRESKEVEKNDKDLFIYLNEFNNTVKWIKFKYYLIDFSNILKQERDFYLTNIIVNADTSQDPRPLIVL